MIFIAAGVLGLAWLLGLPRWLGELGALAGIGSYVLAVGAQPSVIRAGIAGALGSLAWLTARQRDRWHFLLVGALILLAWNPYNLLDAGFQLSFAAVAAIFVAVPRIERTFEGYPCRAGSPTCVAVSLACGVATAPILWLQFGRIPLLLGPGERARRAGRRAAARARLRHRRRRAGLAGVAAALAWANGCLAAYLAGCARSSAGCRARPSRRPPAAIAGSCCRCGTVPANAPPDREGR